MSSSIRKAQRCMYARWILYALNITIGSGNKHDSKKHVKGLQEKPGSSIYKEVEQNIMKIRGMIKDLNHTILRIYRMMRPAIERFSR